MRNPFRGKLFILFLVFYYCCPSYGQLIISLPLNEQSGKDCHDLQFYLISSDTTRIVEIPIGSDEVDNSETLLNKLEDSIWMAIIRYKEDYYMLGFISDKDYQLLSPKSEVILLSPGIRKYDNTIVFVKNFNVIWRNITTYGKCTQSSWKTRKQCINNAKKTFEKAIVLSSSK